MKYLEREDVSDGVFGGGAGGAEAEVIVGFFGDACKERERSIEEERVSSEEGGMSERDEECDGVRMKHKMKW